MQFEELEPSGEDRAQRLHAAFARAVRAIEQLAVDTPPLPSDVRGGAPTQQEIGDLRDLRSTVRGAAAAYARRLRDEGVSPERMLVLVKATTDTARPGVGVRELTNDIVRWSIEAYFAD